MITEIITFHLAPSCSLSSPSSPASKVITDFLAPKLTAHGAHAAYYGAFVEKPDVAIILLEWDSIEDHQKFMNSAYLSLHPPYPTPLSLPLLHSPPTEHGGQ